MNKNAEPKRRVARQIIKQNVDGSPSGGGYQLPTEGIPKSDLSPGVKQSLDRADAAQNELAAHVNDANAHGLDAIRQDIDNLKALGPGTPGGYQPPAGGIPKTDLSTEVQGLLTKAENAVQKGDEFSGDYNDLQNKPQSFPPSSHSHGYSDLSPQVQGLLSLAESSVQEETDPVFAAAEPHLAKLADLEPLATTASLNAEAQARLEADEDLSDRIDAITGSEFSGEYGDLKNKPTEFPPSAHGHVLTDLSQQVQEILGLAETALQEEEDPVYLNDKPDIAMKADLTPLATKTGLSEAVSAEAQSREEADEAHAGDTDIHITAEERAFWDNKLDDDAQAVDSAKLGGKLPSEYATAAQGTKADNALPATAQAVDSAKLDGLESTDFMRTTRLSYTPIATSFLDLINEVVPSGTNFKHVYINTTIYLTMTDRPTPESRPAHVNIYRSANTAVVEVFLGGGANTVVQKFIRHAHTLSTNPEWVDSNWLELATIDDVDAAQFAVNKPDYATRTVRATTNNTINNFPSVLTWAATHNGFARFEWKATATGGTGANGSFILQVNGVEVARVIFSETLTTLINSVVYSEIVPFKAGDVITVTSAWLSGNITAGTMNLVTFQPLKIPAPWSTEIAWLPDYSLMENTNRITTSGGSWTATANGFVRVGVNVSSVNTGESIKVIVNINGLLAFATTVTNNQASGGILGTVLPIKKGDVVNIITAGIGNAGGNPTCHFIPAVAVVPPVINMDYSTQEVNTGKTYNGKPVYRKIINYTSAPLNALSTGYQTISASAWIGANVDTLVSENVFSARGGTWQRGRVGSPKIASGTILNPTQKLDFIDQDGTYGWASTDYTAAQPIILSGWAEYTKQ